MFLNVFWCRFWCKFNAIFVVCVRFGTRFGTRHKPAYSATLWVLIHGLSRNPEVWNRRFEKLTLLYHSVRWLTAQQPSGELPTWPKQLSAILIGWHNLGAMSIDPFGNSVCQIQKSLPGMPGRSPASPGHCNVDQVSENSSDLLHAKTQ